MERNADELLKKIRKGATAGFNTKDWLAVLDSLGGWLWTRTMVNKAPRYKITAPNGNVFHLERQAGYRVITFYDFLPWLKTNGLMEAVEAKLGPAPVKPTRQETEANTGTCPCCFGGFKLKEAKAADVNETVVLHGYQRPGYGYINGRCYGVNWAPYELSCEGTKAFVEIIRRHLAQTRLSLVHWEGRPAEVTETFRDRTAASGVTHRKYTQADKYDYERVLGNIIDRLKRDEDRAKREIAFLEAKIAAWVYAPERIPR